MLLFVDTETTGKPTRRDASWQETSCWPKIVSVAWIVVAGNKVVDRQYYIVKPLDFVIPNDVVKVHGISTESAISEGVLWTKVAKELTNAIDKYNIQTLISHNI